MWNFYGKILLLRAFYKKLEEESKEDDNIKGLKLKIEPCIWKIDPISGKVTDKKNIHIKSKVATATDNDVFHRILAEGGLDNNKSKYQKNYNFFYEKCKEYATENTTRWQGLLVDILKKCIVFPIDCDSFDSALTIFSTLNDRGLPLTDSDIFKSEIYKKTPDNKKEEFITQWKELLEIAKSAKISLNDLFSFYLRYIGGESRKKVEISLRKFYAENSYKRLKEPSLMDDLDKLATFWQAINKKDLDFENKKISLEAYKYLHCLHCYPNEYWRYITSVFYLTKKDDSNFREIFPKFLKRLTAFLYVKFIENPTVNAIKGDTFNECQKLRSKDRNYEMNIKLEGFKEPSLQTMISNATTKIIKGLILLYAYQNAQQKELILEQFEIEHIFPKKWQDTNYNGWNQEDAKEFLEKFGNKMIIEKKCNIQAGNKYFGKKKEVYKTSEIAAVKELAQYPKDDWLKEDIEKREDKFSKTILKFFEENLSPSA